MKIKLVQLTLLLVLFAACTDSQYSEPQAPMRIDSPGMSEVQVALPVVDGIELMERYCVPCHSLRYIEMQPPLDHHAWEKTVTKMIKMYGAPVPDSATAKQIVDYLYKIKGKA